MVQPNGPLHGTVRAGGAKNSALKLMVACLWAEGRTVLSNVPQIDDVGSMADVLRAVGAQVERLDNGDLAVTTPPAKDLHPVAPYELVERMRASVVVLGVLLARCGRVHMPLPGGDDFGERPIDFHVNGLGAMGVHFESSGSEVRGRVEEGRLIGTRVVLEYPSHTATDNLLMAAVLAKGTTVIENAAKEPEVTDLADMLCTMGAVVHGAGTSRLEIEGVEELHPARHSVVPDRVVAATFVAAVGIAGGEVTVADARPEHMEMLLRKVAQMGVVTEMGPQGLRVVAARRLIAADIATLPYPGVATDYSPLLVAMLTVADGVGILTENLFSGRFRYVEELRRMGADIRTEGHHAVVRGVTRLSGAPVRAPDIRAGVALVLAGLVAEGETIVTGAHHIDRGYEDLVGALAVARCQGDEPMNRRPPTDPGQLLALAQGNDRVALARLISLVERGGAPGLAVARLAYRAAVPYTIGLTGAPGSGKSTLTDRLITVVRAGWGEPHPEPLDEVAVLAVDPTSPFSGGAILGDRVRMQQHVLDPTVFIRSMATRGHLGGLALAVPDAVRVLGAAGLPLVIIETVGVGQMEVEVASATDTTVVVVTPGWGDSMQANKAGLLEIADLFVINKADRPGAREARRDLEQMLDLSTLGAWRPPVVDTIAATGEGVAELWSEIARHRAHLETTGSSSRGGPSGWPTRCGGCSWPAAHW